MCMYMYMYMYLSNGLLGNGVHQGYGSVGGSQSDNLGRLDVLQRPSHRHLANGLADHTNS